MTELQVTRDINKDILSRIMSLPDKVRKEIRLLAKQYQILSVSQEPPITIDEFNHCSIVKDNDYIVKYKHFGYNNGNEIFEWVIDSKHIQ